MKVLFSLMLVVFYSVVVFSSNSYAHGNKVTKAAKEESLAVKAYEMIPTSLDSDIPGIVESTIYNAICVKKYYPSADYGRIIDKLNDIAEVYPEASIRVKAHLASIYLSANDIINVVPDHDIYDHNYIYKQIAEQLKNKVLVQK